MNKKIEKIIFIALIIILLLIGEGIYFQRGINKEKSFFVREGESVNTIAQNLKKEGLINNALFFQIYIFGSGNRPNLQAGHYLLNSIMTPYEISQKIINGETIKNIITIPEGWNLRNIAWYFENNGFFQAEELFELVGFPALKIDNELPKPQKYDFNFLKSKPDHVNLEGFIFPDTYELEKDFTLEEFIEKSLVNFNKKVFNKLEGEIENSQYNTFEIITLASLIEKEVYDFQDKQIVAGILWKRFESKMPLQVDATILYVTGKKNEILKSDKNIDSPYNTYKYRGLPLGPICNPGFESIKAALNPKETDYWYYLSTPEGETIFSRTLEEHNIAKNKHLK
jgi:UPF0755 protein